MNRIALLSVSDKSGLIELATPLIEEFGFRLISSGGTARALRAASLPVTEVSEYTGFQEMLGGRVKTLHPRVHGGILARRGLQQDLQDLVDCDIPPIELVVVNLYPFEETIKRQDASLEDAIENIDIGGPALLRAAAKNYAYVTVLCQSEQYADYLRELRQHGETSLGFRQRCSLSAFHLTAAYDQLVSDYLQRQFKDTLLETSDTWHLRGRVKQELRYGENPHQTATWYATAGTPQGWTTAKQLQGKELSYNNLLDLEAARSLIAEFPTSRPAVAIIKHNNPCGVAQHENQEQAYRMAFATDSVSAFGGIVALNTVLSASTALALTETFLECIVAPEIEQDAIAILQRKSNLRVMILPNPTDSHNVHLRMIAGGFLLQSADNLEESLREWTTVTGRPPSETELEDLLFAWRVVKHVKSNAIVVAKREVTLGIGCGQTNRVGAVKLALEAAGTNGQGSVLASDAFFPFKDSVLAAAQAGITAIVQPGGSLRDQESIEAANEHGIGMVFTGRRHFLH
ncbi:MAG: bifunctional phosphoribosylaminoimidazolecarboxamide formyltransferase/IMP cyclohydrolase [Gloeomargaritaceae cyanobacterium C42_A2020_066]|nr:bifunctional phosphoribosylaminoimidazolecarboxamide formyltransferase/IMP cyclohydrolase [Gloeomargaritaceae cyanobacterium C42_A2020_066]